MSNLQQVPYHSLLLIRFTSQCPSALQTKLPLSSHPSHCWFTHIAWLQYSFHQAIYQFMGKIQDFVTMYPLLKFSECTPLTIFMVWKFSYAFHAKNINLEDYLLVPNQNSPRNHYQLENSPFHQPENLSHTIPSNLSIKYANFIKVQHYIIPYNNPHDFLPIINTQNSKIIKTESNWPLSLGGHSSPPSSASRETHNCISA